MKYDERTCKFNMDTGCVELLLRDGRMISIDCTRVEDALDKNGWKVVEHGVIRILHTVGTCYTCNRRAEKITDLSREAIRYFTSSNGSSIA